jgi:hypothetical protein
LSAKARLKGRDYGCACKVCRGGAEGVCRYKPWVEELRELVLEFTEEGKEELGCTCRATRVERCDVCRFTKPKESGGSARL